MELSIIIVNYNGGKLVEQCLQSIYANPPRGSFETILLDNGSPDGSGEHAAARFPQVRFVQVGANVGLSTAFNRGLALAHGVYVLSLDNDTRALPGSLTGLLEAMDRLPRAGAVGSLVLNPDLTPQKTARRAPSALNAIFGRRSLVTRWLPNNPLSRRYLMEDWAESEVTHEVDWLSAAALMVRREVIDAVGGLDEVFFVYWVDADLCARIRRAGWTINVVPTSRIIHDENLKGRRRARRSTKMLVDFHRGAYLYYRRNHTRWVLSPMAALAFSGLALRAAALIAWDYLRAPKVKSA